MVRVGGLQLLVEQGITSARSRRHDAGRATEGDQPARATRWCDDQHACFARNWSRSWPRRASAACAASELTDRQLAARRAGLRQRDLLGPDADGRRPRPTTSRCSPIRRCTSACSSSPIRRAASSRGSPSFRCGRSLPRFLTLGCRPRLRVHAAGRCRAAVRRPVLPRREGRRSACRFRITRNADFSAPRRPGGRPAGRHGGHSRRPASTATACGWRVAADASREIAGVSAASRCDVGDDDVFHAPRPARPVGLHAADRPARLRRTASTSPGRRSRRPISSPAQSMFEILARAATCCSITPMRSSSRSLRLIEEAADDPDVLAIKQILYRTSRNSPIVAALARAAAARQVRDGDRRAQGPLRRSPQHRMGPQPGSRPACR